jgi:hypothetical protein
MLAERQKAYPLSQINAKLDYLQSQTYTGIVEGIHNFGNRTTFWKVH